MDEIEKLKEENEHLKKMVGLKSELISITAHQLRTSLSAFKWMLKMFLNKDFGALSTEQEAFLSRSYESNERMIRLVSEMLTINKTEDTILKYDFVAGDLENLIESVIFEFEGESHEKSIELIHFKSKEKIPELKFDQDKIRVVLQNLIDNALKYSNHGGHVFVSTKISGNMVEISVKDTGIGISKEQQEKIFEKFFRADNARKKESVGSGLGLYTVKTIVEKHGGKLWFESQEGQGSTFFFTLSID